MTEKEMTRMGFAAAVAEVCAVLPELQTFPLPSAVPTVFNRYIGNSFWES